MIASFGDAATEDLYHGKNTARVRQLPSDVVRAARRKLDRIQNAHVLGDLLVPPGNRLEALQGDQKGKWSIRVNQQFRIVFRWEDSAAHDVMFGNYH